MEEITFSFFDRGRDVPNHIQALVEQFENEEGIHVRLEVIPWSAGWARMVEVALYHNGPDVSEIGSTWAGDLTRMESLRPFRQNEIKEITGEDTFFESVWDSVGKTKDDPSAVYSIPWSADVRAVFYRKDWLGKAGVDTTKAFTDPLHFEEMLAALKGMKLPIPLALPTARTNLTIHNMASWIWESGGSLLSADNLGITFDEPQAIAGASQYFRLGRYLGEAAHLLGDFDAYALFYSGKAAVVMGGAWILHTTAISDEVRSNMGIAPIPAPPFVGGNHLVIWNHSRHEMAAKKFINFLHSEKAGKLIYPQFGLPVRPLAWNFPPFDQADYQVLLDSIKKGRGFPTGQLWGLVEKRLSDVLADIWASILKDPAADPKLIVEPQLKGLANRLRLTLGNSHL